MLKDEALYDEIPKDDWIALFEKQFESFKRNNIHAGRLSETNTAFGFSSFKSNTSGNNNTAIGVGTLDRNTGGNENAILGAFAGRYIADGSTYNTSTSNSVLINIPLSTSKSRIKFSCFNELT